MLMIRLAEVLKEGYCNHGDWTCCKGATIIGFRFAVSACLWERHWQRVERDVNQTKGPPRDRVSFSKCFVPLLRYNQPTLLPSFPLTSLRCVAAATSPQTLGVAFVILGAYAKVSELRDSCFLVESPDLAGFRLTGGRSSSASNSEL